MRRILVTGIPGTGKTTIGRYLVQQHGFEHLDFETPAHAEHYLSAGKRALLEKLGMPPVSQDMVISWGFLPETQLPFVLALRDSGYDWIWFDGDRAAARRAFLERGTSSEEAFEMQMRAIDEYLDLDLLHPRTVSPFDCAGRFRPLAHIAEDVLRLSA